MDGVCDAPLVVFVKEYLDWDKSSGKIQPECGLRARRERAS